MPPEEKPTLMDTVDAAIADATPPPLENNDPPPDGEGAQGNGDEEGADAAAGGEQPTGDEAGAGGDADDQSGEGPGDAGDAEPSGDGAEGAADGEGKDGADGAAAAAAGGKKPDGEAAVDDKGKPKPAAAAPDPKKPDHVNDPIPKDLNERTRTRMTALVDTVKNITKERDTARDENQTFLKAIAETGADPETFARHVEVLRLINSPKPEEQRQAVKMLRTVADRMAKDLGDVEPGKELEGHADLLEEIENGDLSRERATEIAIARNRENADKTRRERTEAASKEQSEEKKAHEAGVAALNELEQELLAAEPNKETYYAKRELVERALRAVVPDIHPSKWASTYKRMYASLDPKSIRPAAPRVGDGGAQRVRNGTGNRQPMRPKQGAGAGAQAEPKSLAEAIDFGIKQAAR